VKEAEALASHYQHPSYRARPSHQALHQGFSTRTGDYIFNTDH